MRTFFDTNVLVYLFDGRAPRKQQVAEQLVAAHMRNGTLVISTQVLLELYAVLTRKRGLDATYARSIIEPFAAEEVVPATADLVTRALELSASHRLSHWDAMIVRAAQAAECATLLSEDLQAGARFGSLVVLDPFAPGVQHAAPPTAIRGPRTARTGAGARARWRVPV
jgi:predicted nucleic acid-binding protein